MEVQLVLEEIYLKCRFFKDSPFIKLPTISKIELSNYLHTKSIDEPIISFFLNIIYDELEESTEAITTNGFITKYTKLLDLIPESYNINKHHLETSLSKITTLSNEQFNNSIINDIKNNLNIFKPLNKWVSKAKKSQVKSISLPINTINTPSLGSSISKGKDIDILLRTKFDVQDYLASIHKRKTNKNLDFIINSNSRNSPSFSKIGNKSYSITNRLLDVYDHIHIDDPKYINIQREYFHVDQKDNEEPKKSLITLTNRYNKIIKKEKENLLFNKLKPNSTKSEFSIISKGTSPKLQQQGQLLYNIKSNGISSERSKKPVMIKI